MLLDSLWEAQRKFERKISPAISSEAENVPRTYATTKTPPANSLVAQGLVSAVVPHWGIRCPTYGGERFARLAIHDYRRLSRKRLCEVLATPLS